MGKNMLSGRYVDVDDETNRLGLYAPLDQRLQVWLAPDVS
jgi:hypothetical protein